MIKICLLGDSITEGIGSKKINYSEMLNENLGNNYIVKNFAKSGTTIKYANQIINEIKDYEPDILIIWYGNVDALPRPNINAKLNIYGMLSERYKKNGMMNPRAIYSSKKIKRIFQKIDSYFRVELNRVLIAIQGYYQWCETSEFSDEYNKFIKEFEKEEKILISTVAIDDFFFPHANLEYERYNRKIKEIAEINNCSFIDIKLQLETRVIKEYYYEDNFHINLKGYKLVEKMIRKIILK